MFLQANRLTLSCPHRLVCFLQGQRHPLMFAREVVANLLGMPERADWKNCALSVEEETATANKFKELFKPYDWSLE